MPHEPREIINSVGIELEFMNINKNSNSFNLDIASALPGYKLDHDASCESYEERMFGLPIKFTSKKAQKILQPLLNTIIIGGEIVSPIKNTNSPQWINDIENICNILKEHGEPEHTPRASLHIHINLSKEAPLYVLKNILKLTLKYEAFLFKLGGMGQINRGIENNFVFQRPYLKHGPPVIIHKGENLPILNPFDLLEAETKDTFFYRYGNSTLLETKYVTQRYMCVNFVPLLTQGSIEFRTANKTLNSKYIVAWTNFCKAFITNSFTTSNIELDKLRPLANNQEISLNTFLNEIQPLNLDEDTLNILSKIWKESPTPFFDNIWRYSHLKNPTGFRNIGYLPTILDKNTKVKKAVFIDIHNLENPPEN